MARRSSTSTAQPRADSDPHSSQPLIAAALGLCWLLSGDRQDQALLADRPVDQFPYDIHLPDVPRIFLQQMDENPAKRWRITGEPATQPGALGQIRLAGSHLSARRDGRQPCGQIGDRVAWRDEPTLRVWVVIAPRVRHLLGFEAPLHPAPLDEDQVSKKPEWRPPRREDAGGQLLFAQTVELGEQSGAVVAQLLQQDFPRILDRMGRFAAQLTHEGEASGEKFVHGADGVEFSVGPARRRRAAAFALLLWGRPIAASSPEEVGFAHA